MNSIKNSTILVLVFLSFISCTKSPGKSISDEKIKIMELHNAQRDYHFNKDSIAFANQFSDNFISVNRGEISSPTKAETIARYNRYFSSVEFLKWDDVSEPIITFSDDGSMAFTVVDKIVELSYKDENGNTVIDNTHFAWTAIYKKYGKNWKIESVTSTDRSSGN